MQSLLSLLATVVAMLPGLTSPSGTYSIQEGDTNAAIHHDNVQAVSHTAQITIDLDQPERDSKVEVLVSDKQKANAESELTALFNDAGIQTDEQVHTSPSVSHRSNTPVIDLDQPDSYVTQDVDAYSRTLSYNEKKASENALTQLFADMGIE